MSRQKRASLNITPQQRKAARALVRGQKSPREALESAGYSRSTARRGAQQIVDSAGLRLAVLDEIKKCRKIELPTPNEQADFVRWKLLVNAAQGKDRAVQSLKLLGSDKRCAMWQPDSQMGVIIVGTSARLDALALEFQAGSELSPAPEVRGESP
jgi:hypothetical protein